MWTKSARTGRWQYKATIAGGTTSEPIYLNKQGGGAADVPASVGVVPQSSALVEFTISSDVDVELDAAQWHESPAGTVAAATVEALPSAVEALRVTATGGDCLLEIKI